MIINKLSTFIHNIVIGSYVVVQYSNNKIKQIKYNGNLTKLTILSLLYDENITNIYIKNDINGNNRIVNLDILDEFKKNNHKIIDIIKKLNQVIDLNEFSNMICNYSIIQDYNSYTQIKTKHNDSFTIIKNAIYNNKYCIFFLIDNNVLIVDHDNVYIRNFDNLFRGKYEN